MIGRLKDWNGIADADSSVFPSCEATRRAALDLILEPYLGEDTDLYRWRSSLSPKSSNRSPAKWLPPAYKSYDDLLVAAPIARSRSSLNKPKAPASKTGSGKNFNSLDMLHPIGREGFLKHLLSITGKPQSGTGYSVRAATKRHGPSMRFVANPANWDESILLIPAGESGQVGSSHYTDQFSYWYRGQTDLFSVQRRGRSKSAQAHADAETMIVIPGNSISTCQNFQK